MALIRIREWLDGVGGANAKLGFDHGEEYPITISDPFSEEQEQELEWYFERHLYFPFTDVVRARDAARSINTYGEILFKQVFSDTGAYARYKACLNTELDPVQIEIVGSPAFHRWHWEALKDPDLPQSLSLHTTIVRKHINPTRVPATVQPSPTINILLVIARPSGKRDVGYRTISRPVVESLRQSNLLVKIDILRPSTYRALVTHLRETTAHYGAGYYHVIHFDVHGALHTYEMCSFLQKMRRIDQERYGRDDLAPYVGKKAFLSLEGERDGTADLVEASEVADLLLAHQIPIAILNACQSGKQIGASETSLGSRLMQAGAQLVLAMSYSITISAASILMSSLYSELFVGHDLSVAIRKARQELASRKGRRVAFNQEINLEDWLLPVVYQSQPLHLHLRPFTSEEEAEFSQRKTHQYRPPEPLYSFIGRDLDILQIEKLLLTKCNIVLVRGMGGAGKTTLLEYLGAWWQTTGFVDHVYYFGYDKRAWTLQQLLVTVAKQFFGEEAYIHDYQSLSLDAQQDKLTEHLRAHRHLLILDNLESITGTHFAIRHTLPLEEQNALHCLLAALSGGKTLVLLGSRGGEDWLAKDTFENNVYDLGGLDYEAASTLADRILERNNATQYRKDEDLRKLIKLLDCFPLAMEVILANLTQQSPTEILAALQSGDLNLHIGNSQEKTENILRCVDYSYNNLSPEARQLLLCLFPFTSVLVMNVFENYSLFLKKQPPLATLPFEQWNKVLHEAKHWGLLKADEHIPELLYLHPILPYFLRTHLRESGKDEMRRAVETAFRMVYDQVAVTLSSAQTSKNPLEQQLGQIFTDLEYENLTTALHIALADQVSILNPYDPLSKYLSTIQDRQRQLELGQIVLERLEAYPSDQLVGKMGSELVAIMQLISDAQLQLKQYTAAEATCQKALSLWLQNKHYNTDAIKIMSSSVYQRLGRIAEEQGKWEEAEHYFQEALHIEIRYKDHSGQATVYHLLGGLAERQGRWEKAEYYFQEALKLKIGYTDRQDHALTYHQLGKVAKEQRRWEEAEHYYREALRIFIEYHDRYKQGCTYHNLGMMAQEQRKWQEAKYYYQEALRIFIESGLLYEQARPYHQLGVVAQEQENWEEAERYYSEALQIKIKYNDRPEQAFTYHQLGRVAEEQKRWKEAEKYYQEALHIFIEYGLRYEQASPYHQLGSVAQRQERWEEAERYYQQALLIFVEYKDRYGQASVYGQLGILARDREQWKQAKENTVHALEIFVDIEDSYNSTLIFHKLALYWLKSEDESLPDVVAGIIRSSREEVMKSWGKLLEILEAQ